MPYLTEVEVLDPDRLDATRSLMKRGLGRGLLNVLSRWDGVLELNFVRLEVEVQSNAFM